MSTNYKSSGMDVIFTAAKDYSSSDIVVVGNLLGVAHDDVATGEQGVAIIEGVFALPKADGVALSQGDIVGYKAATGVIQPIEQPEDGDLSGAGVVVQDAGAADDTVMLKINTGVGGSGGGKVPVPDGGLTFTVGSGGDYATLGAAIDGVTSVYAPDGPGRVTINILAGTTLAEQLVFDSGRDFSWITVTGADVETPVDGATFTTDTSFRRPFIHVMKGTVAPKFEHTFAYSPNGQTSEVNGVNVEGQGSWIDMSNSGLKGFTGNALDVSYQAAFRGNSIVIDGASCTRSTVVNINYSAHVQAEWMEVSNGSDWGVYVGYQSFLGANGGTFANNFKNLEVAYNSMVEVNFGTFSGSTAFDVNCVGSTADVGGSSCSLNANDLVMSNGGIIRAVGSNGGTTYVPNTIQADGIIFQ